MKALCSPPSAVQPPLTDKGLRALTRARAALVMDHPFFAALALRLRFKPDPSCRDLWTDGRLLGFNPVYACALSDKKLVGALAHEVLHLAFGHHVRRKGRDEQLWNRACDYAINIVLLEAAFALPEGFAHDPSFAGMSVDDIYKRLAQLEDEKSSRGRTGGPGDASPLLGAAAAEQGEKGREKETDQGSPGASYGQGKENKGQEGQSRSGKARETRQESQGTKAARAFTGEVRDHPLLDGKTDAKAQKAAEQEADVILSQAVQRARNMGSLPAGLSRLVRQVLAPRLDWKELLRRFLEDCADCDYSWTTPNRRFIHQGIYLPSRREPRIPHIALAVDSSGSVDEQALALFCAELSALLEEWDTTLTVLFHDSKVQSERSFTRQDLPLALSPIGGGGTDFRPVCAHIDTERLMPTCLIWFTDLQCDRFPEEPPYPVLWVSTLAPDKDPPFGDLIVL